jgi:hypothetical protein
MVCLPRYAGVMTSIHREIPMRVPALTILTLLTVLSAVPAKAQTYGGNGPICLERFEWGGSRTIYCDYSSMAQCQATASGLSAMCSTNPYYSNAQAPRGPGSRRLRRGY